ncbi:hypothetical protein AbraIFM66951_005429 [Aspergillus brasiliensis]|uniref:Uncharacterized protein n=1 Tax=Aspergillus brasiliensis TaxID=319629 RepID=A0A9W5YRF7_9EURO|nr:hypothetical protein AbraCBS73388_006305 [Aspergillus brasiliensis]GKZ43862.1 hypothetical protein AbraIFM66951_005429 [Aspergillus brasiliensis]
MIGDALGQAPDSSLYPSPPRGQPLEDGLYAWSVAELHVVNMSLAGEAIPCLKGLLLRVLAVNLPSQIQSSRPLPTGAKLLH